MQEINEIIGKLRERLVEYFSIDKSGHDLGHLERTLKNALFLQSKEGGDITVIAVSAFIHDIHRIMSISENSYVSPKESLPVVRKFLEGLGLTEEQKEHILFAVEHHEEYAFGEDEVSVSDIESKILQDADNLDGIGAVGLVRTIKYSIAHNREIYDPSVPLYQNKYSEKTDDASTIHHIYNKLIRLGENMNTKTAKKLAKEKTEFLKKFADMYIDEVSDNLK